MSKHRIIDETTNSTNLTPNISRISRREFFRKNSYTLWNIIVGSIGLGACAVHLYESYTRFDEVRYAIPWEFKDIDGNRFSYRGVEHGKPTVINFWASWCSPCRAELPDYIDAIETYGREPVRSSNPRELFTGPVDFLMISTDDDIEVLKRYVEDNNNRSRVDDNDITFPILLDEGYNDEYGVNAIPCSIFIRRDGTISYKQLGAMSRRRLQGEIEEILRE